MSTDTPTPERVTLTAEERAHLRDSGSIGRVNYIEAVEHILTARLAAREQALREENADLRSRLGCVTEATYWDRPYDTRINAIRGMCDLTTNGMTPAGGDR